LTRFFYLELIRKPNFFDILVIELKTILLMAEESKGWKIVLWFARVITIVVFLFLLWEKGKSNPTLNISFAISFAVLLLVESAKGIFKGVFRKKQSSKNKTTKKMKFEELEALLNEGETGVIKVLRYLTELKESNAEVNNAIGFQVSSFNNEAQNKKVDWNDLKNRLAVFLFSEKKLLT